MKLTINPVIVQAYAVKHKVTMKEAREKLKKNYEKEVETVDFRDLVLRAMDGIRQMSPKIQGCVDRENDNITAIRQIDFELNETKTSFYVFKDSTSRRINELIEGQIQLKSSLINLEKENKEMFSIINKLTDIMEKMQNKEMFSIINKLTDIMEKMQKSNKATWKKRNRGIKDY